MLISSNPLTRSAQALNDTSQAETSVAADATTNQAPDPPPITPDPLASFAPTDGLQPVASGQTTKAASGLAFGGIIWTYTHQRPSADATTNQMPKPPPIAPASLTSFVPTAGLHPSGQTSSTASVSHSAFAIVKLLDSATPKLHI